MRKPVLARFSSFILLVTAFFVTGVPQPLSAQTKPAPKPLTLKAGDTAPDFTLLAFDGTQLKKVSLHDYRGKKNVALAFYVFAFTGG